MCWLAVLIAVTAWRWIAFGSVVPNSVLAKSVPLSRAVLSLGGGYLGGFVAAYPHWIVAAAIGLIAVRRNPIARCAAAILLLQIPIVLRNGGDWMPHHRLLTQYAPLFALLAGFGLQALLSATRVRSLAQVAAGALAALCLFSFLRTELHGLRRSALGLEVTRPAWAYGALAKELRPALRPDDLIAPEAIGMIGYELRDVRIHDIFGLADAWIARNGPTPQTPFGKNDFAYSLRCRPTMFIFHSGDVHPGHMNSMTAGGLAVQYRRVLLRAVGLTVFVRPDDWPRFAEAFSRFDPVPSIAAMPESPAGR